MIKIQTCGFCHCQILDDHDCPEKRAAQQALNELGRVPTAAQTLHERRPAQARGKAGPVDEEAGDE